MPKVSSDPFDEPFLCRFQCSTDEWYIDAFNRGKLLSRTNCVKFLVQTNYGFQEVLLAPATPRRAAFCCGCAPTCTKSTSI